MIVSLFTKRNGANERRIFHPFSCGFARPCAEALFRLVLLFIVTSLASQVFALSQSGAVRDRARWVQYGVNLTYAVYQYDAARSPEMNDITRLSGTFSTAEEEIAYLKEKYKLEEVEVRHVRSVGLIKDESFNDAVLLGPEYMTFYLTPRSMARGNMKLDFRVRYANKPTLEVEGVEFSNFETVILRGGAGAFGIKYFIGAGGRRESASIERTLLVSVTPEITPVQNLRNRPEQLSRPVDENGSPIDLKEGDRFTPPVALERVVPRFESSLRVRGSVLLTGIVAADGEIRNVRVIRGIDSVIDERAVDAFRRYRFSPALLNGKPASATYTEELSFDPGSPSLLEIQQEIEKQREKEKEKKKDKKP